MRDDKWIQKYVNDKLHGYNKELDFYIDGYYTTKEDLPTNPCSDITSPTENKRRRLLIRRAA